MSNAQKLLQYQPITGADAGSFANFTIKKRLPEILKRIMSDSGWNQKTKEELNALQRNICYGKIELFPATGPDIQTWAGYQQPYLGKSWFDAPFYFVEAYFYRLILDAVNYFEDHLDPFLNQKIGDASKNISEMAQYIAQFDQSQSLEFQGKLHPLLQLCLWGNKSDLSQLKMNRSTHDSDATLIDDTPEIVNRISGGLRRVDIVLDNAGMELFTDLLLAEWLISQNLVDQVILHVKAYPTFVSDATTEDVNILIKLLEKNSSLSTKAFAGAFKHYCEEDRIMISTHEFWNAPLNFFEMPEQIHADLAKSDLIIFKGDANYRRIFGDRLIPYHVHPQRLATYLPSKSVSIRILKSEIVTGISLEKSNILTTEMGNEWLVSGRFGIIQVLN
jgi:uncharacterized protein with ATP-grasp and redox domains